LIGQKAFISVLPFSTFVDGKVELLDVTESSDREIAPLTKGDIIKSGKWICTGPDSRFELSADENIFYRAGSMSVVSFEHSNSFRLHSGSFIFCTKEKNSIFHIRSHDANATFVGSGTILIEATSNGGFKFLPIEGRGTLVTDKGGVHNLQSGRMILVLEQPSTFGDSYDIDLMLLIKSCHLLNSFPEALPTFGRISLAIYSQELRMKGRYEALIGDAPTNENLQIWTFGDSSK